MASDRPLLVHLRIDQASMEAAIHDLERHYLKYGDPPQPHMKAEAERNMARIVNCIHQSCFDTEI